MVLYFLYFWSRVCSLQGSMANESAKTRKVVDEGLAPTRQRLIHPILHFSSLLFHLFIRSILGIRCIGLGNLGDQMW